MNFGPRNFRPGLSARPKFFLTIKLEHPHPHIHFVPGRKSGPKIPWAESPGRKFLGPKVRVENSLGRNSCNPNLFSILNSNRYFFLSSGNSGVIRDKLSSMWIPAGWTWGGLVSNHCPIWTEFNLS